MISSLGKVFSVFAILVVAPVSAGMSFDPVTPSLLQDTARSKTFRLELAYCWAPIHYQDVDRTGSGGLAGRSDYVTAIDFDGDWNTLNNWENTPHYSLTAHCYFSVVETGTHWYIVYAFFHPRDWTDHPFETEHENDLEGLLAVVRRPSSGAGRYGTLLGMITVSHRDFFSFIAPGSPLRDGHEDVDGTLHMESWRGLKHPRTAQQSKGHGLKAWPEYTIDGGDGIVYYPSRTTAEEPSGPNDRHVLYKLVDIFEPRGLWERRNDPVTFAKFGTFVGDNGGRNKANAPWGWDDKDDGPTLLGGELALEPAKIARHYFDGWRSFDASYSFNVYQGIDGGGAALLPLVYRPPFTGGGDRDFDGHGPRVDLEVEMAVKDDVIKARVSMNAREWKNGRPKSNHTQANGTSPWAVVYRAPSGRRITSIGCSKNPVTATFIDTDHETDTFRASADGFVQSFEVVGDTKGDEAGTRTRVKVNFHHLNVKTATKKVEAAPTNRPRKQPNVVLDLTSHITTGSSDSRLLEGDWEIDSDDWTLLEASYTTRITDGGRAVDLTLTWNAYEREGNKGYKRGNTHIRSTRTLRIWRQPAGERRVATRIVRGGSGNFSQYVRGKVHGSHSYPSFGGMGNVSISFDGKGRDDNRRQSFSGTLSLSLQLTSR